MSDRRRDEVTEFWNRVAADWEIQVGDEGDSNRRLNSDPVLWRLTGDVQGLKVLDAGCGTGYLSRQLRDRGAVVTGVDISERMIEIARSRNDDIDYRVESCATLPGLPDSSFDLLLANYVLMDVEQLEGAVASFHRVLKRSGRAVLVLSHPCFPQGSAEVSASGPEQVSYHWSFNYFESCRRVDPPWGHFKSEFIWFHRPLSLYFRLFRSAGFEVTDLEEPRVTPERHHLVEDENVIRNSRTRPFSIAFRLVKR